MPRRKWAIVAIALGITVAVLDGVIANVALPSIAEDLHINPASSIWIVNAYQLAIMVSLLSLSFLGDLWGYKKVYLCGLTLFCFTSLACALSDSMATLTFSRVLQGFGAAAITSVNTALVRIIYPKRMLGVGMGINAVVVSVSAAAGPTVAASILTFGSWPWLFAVNIPICLAALWIGYKALPKNRYKNDSLRFDWPSAVMNAFTFGLLIFIIDGFAHDFRLSLMIPVMGLALLIGFFFIRRQLRLSNPLLPVDLLRIPIFSLSIITSVCSFMAQMLAMVSMPFFLQNTLMRDEVMTGLLLTPWPVATMIVAPIAGHLILKVKAGILGGIGMIIFSFGLFLLAFLPAGPSNIDIIWRMVLCGIGFGLFQTPNNSVIISSAPESRSGGASGMLGTARLLGQTSGAALVALMFNLYPAHSASPSLLLAGILAIAAAIVSLLRISQPQPAALTAKKG